MNAAAFCDALIVRCEEKDAPASYTPDASGYDVLDVTFYTITTEKGAIDVILHVDHNGYYGGWLHEPVLTGHADFPAGVV